MFGLFKKIFKKEESGNSVIAPASPAAPAYSRTATPGQPGRPQSNPFSDAGASAPAATANPMPPSAASRPLSSNAAKVQPRAAASVERIPTAVTLPLDEIVPGLTHEFQSLFEPAKDTEVSFPLQVILPQLSTGRIRVSFGDLRNACPNGSCKAGPEHDAKLVDLPLAKVLSRVNPAFLPRKTQRPAMDVPEDVTGLFGTTGEPLPSVAPSQRASVVQSVPPAASARTAPEASALPSPRPAARPAPPSVPKPTANRKQAVTDDELGDIPSPFNFQQSPSEEAAPSAPTAAPVQRPPSGAQPQSEKVSKPELEDVQPIKFSLSDPAAPPVVPEPEVVAAPVPKPAPAPIAKSVPKPATPAPAKAPMPAPPAKPLAAAISKNDDDNFIVLPVAKVQADWSDSVQDEIKQYNLGSAEFALPYGEVDMSMRKGKIVFPWKTLRGWITPADGVPASTSADNEELVLPLKMVAPLFLAQRQTPSKKRKVSAEEEEIPDLFSGGPAEEPEVPTAPQPVPAQPAPTAQAPAPKPAQPAPAAASVMPKVSASNPAELVTRTASMPGVSGALLAMSDGLMVASELPKPLVGETVAAFLPQIFGRLTQFSTELKLGDLTSVMLVMDNSPWIIFRTGKVYFAVVGKSGEALPLPQLTAIVADIKRQNL